jgi:DNA adenine methylase
MHASHNWAARWGQEAMASSTPLSAPPRPILRWAGSKRRQLPLLRACTPHKFRTYFEPFVGSASLYLSIKPEFAVLGDINADLMATYKAVRSAPERVAHLAHSIPTSREDYYRIRGTPEADPFAAAARFIYLNRYCFNGIYRTDKLGNFNVPYGSRTGSMPSVSDFRYFADCTADAKLESTDFTHSLAGAKRGDFAYLDPPYLTTNRNSYGEYGYGTYRQSDLRRLIDCLTDLDTRKVKILLSYRIEEELLAALSNWSIAEVKVYRNVAARGRQRMRTVEILASNYADVKAIVRNYKV